MKSVIIQPRHLSRLLFYDPMLCVSSPLNAPPQLCKRSHYIRPCIVRAIPPITTSQTAPIPRYVPVQHPNHHSYTPTHQTPLTTP